MTSLPSSPSAATRSVCSGRSEPLEFGFRVHLDIRSATTWSSTEVVYSDRAPPTITSTWRPTPRDASTPSPRTPTTSTRSTAARPVAAGRRSSTCWGQLDARHHPDRRAGLQGVRAVHALGRVTGAHRVPRRGHQHLTFGGETIFISSAATMNNLSGMKQGLPAGNLIAVAENGSKCLYNSIGNPPNGTTAPAAPTNLNATLVAGPPKRTDLSWTAAGGTIDGYNVYRQVNGGGFTKLNGALVASTTFSDNALVDGQLCYQVRSQRSGVESSPTSSACVDNSPAPLPPGAPQSLTAQLVDSGNVTSLLSLPFDEGSGQTANDQSGNANHGRLGSADGVDTADPLWVAESPARRCSSTLERLCERGRRTEPRSDR